MKYFTQEDIEVVSKQRKKAIIGLYSILAIFLIVSIGYILWYMTLPYKSPTIKIIKLLHYATHFFFVILFFIYAGIYFKRINKRYKMQRNMEIGIKETSIGTFLEYCEEIQENDGVDFKSLVFIEWNKYKKNFFERKVLVFADRPFPEIELDAKVQFITQNNVLLEYEYLGEDLEKTKPPKNISKTIKRDKEEYFD